MIGAGQGNSQTGRLAGASNGPLKVFKIRLDDSPRLCLKIAGNIALPELRGIINPWISTYYEFTLEGYPVMSPHEYRFTVSDIATDDLVIHLKTANEPPGGVDLFEPIRAPVVAAQPANQVGAQAGNPAGAQAANPVGAAADRGFFGSRIGGGVPPAQAGLFPNSQGLFGNPQRGG